MTSGVDIVNSMWNGRFARGEELDVITLLSDPEIIESNRRVVAPDAEIEFAAPDGGFIGQMKGPFRGPDDLLSAWREWVEPWESYRIRVDESIEEGPGVVLMLGEASGRVAGSTQDIETPIGAVFCVRDGHVVRMQHFLDQEQACRAALAEL